MSSKIHTGDIVAEICRNTEADRDLVAGVVGEAIDVIARALKIGKTVKLRRLGTFKWVETPGRNVNIFSSAESVWLPAGRRLKFVPASSIPKRRRD